MPPPMLGMPPMRPMGPPMGMMMGPMGMVPPPGMMPMGMPPMGAPPMGMMPGMGMGMPTGQPHHRPGEHRFGAPVNGRPEPQVANKAPTSPPIDFDEL